LKDDEITFLKLKFSAKRCPASAPPLHLSERLLSVFIHHAIHSFIILYQIKGCNKLPFLS